MKFVAHLLRVIGFVVLSMAHVSLGCNEPNSEARLKIVIPILISIRNKDEHQKTGQDLMKDQANRFLCQLLDIPWPDTNYSKLWHIENKLLPYSAYRGDKELKNRDDIPIKYSSNPYAKNPYGLSTCFSLPDSLPDKFIKCLVKDSIITRSFENADIEFVLVPTDGVLQKLGLFEERAAIQLPPAPAETPVILPTITTPTDRKDEARKAVREEAMKSSLACTFFSSIVIITTGFGAVLWLVA